MNNRCLGCGVKFHGKNNTRLVCGKCKKLSRNNYEGTDAEFREEIRLAKEQFSEDV